MGTTKTTSDEVTDQVWTVVAVYNGELRLVEVWNTEKLANERAQEIRDGGVHFVEVDEHEIGT